MFHIKVEVDVNLLILLEHGKVNFILYRVFLNGIIYFFNTLIDAIQYSLKTKKIIHICLRNI